MFKRIALRFMRGPPRRANALEESSDLSVFLDVNYRPHKGWLVKQLPDRNYILSSDELPSPLHIGKPTSYVYLDRGITTAGLGRAWYDGTPGHITFDPEHWNDEFSHWPELLYPTAFAESGADFSVINAWDLAGLTVGFIQLAAHTSDDLIPFFRVLVSSLPQEAEKYFPELTLVNGELCYTKAGRYRRLEVRAPAMDPVPNDLVDRGLFMSFFNRNRKSIGTEELHAAARWLAWTAESKQMRRLQVSASIANMRDSLIILHKALLRNAAAHYPKGVDGMRCDHLAAGLAVPHLNPGRVGKAVWALSQPNVLEAFAQIEYGPGNREKNVVEGVRKRGKRLADLKFDLAMGRPG